MITIKIICVKAFRPCRCSSPAKSLVPLRYPFKAICDCRVPRNQQTINIPFLFYSPAYNKSFNDAHQKGFDDKDTYALATEKGFPSFATYEEGYERGFVTYEKLLEANRLKVRDFEDMMKYKGITSNFSKMEEEVRISTALGEVC